MTIPRFLFIILIGILLFSLLLYLSGLFEHRYIKRRNKLNMKSSGKYKEGIIVILYLSMLFLIIILGFIMIKSNIRSIK
ncbi:MAG: hypothetical protein H6Q59_2315 [Firmicutes bacterium]|nr:hypothetical protein [Bacillota bacterium]